MIVRFAVGGKSKSLYLNIVLHQFGGGGERIRFHLMRIEALNL